MTDSNIFSAEALKSQENREVFIPPPITPKLLSDLYNDRCILFNLGYEPLPVEAASKRPRIMQWTSGKITKELLRYLTYNHSDHLSTGLRTGRLVGIDIDLYNDEHSEIIRELTENIIGITSLKRRGSKGYMLCYRNTDTPSGRRYISSTVEGAKEKTLLEILGLGQQFVAFGIHPTTQKPYQWLVEGYNPFTVPFQDLPPVSNEQLDALIIALSKRLTELGYQVKDGVTPVYTTPAPLTGRQSDAESVSDLFLRLMPCGPDRKGYYNFPCPLCRCDDGRSGFCITAEGGCQFHCFHVGCDFHKTTGWKPDGVVGKKVRQLYKLLGGDEADLIKFNKDRQTKMTEEYRNSIKETYDLMKQLKRNTK